MDLDSLFHVSDIAEKTNLEINNGSYKGNRGKCGITMETIGFLQEVNGTGLGPRFVKLILNVLASEAGMP